MILKNYLLAAASVLALSAFTTGSALAQRLRAW